MKKLLLFVVVLFVAAGVFAQGFTRLNSLKSDFKLPQRTLRIDNYDVIGQQPAAITHNKAVMDDPSMAMTNYDLPSNASDDPHRIFMYPDGKMGAVCTWSHDLGGSFPDRGTGYNSYDGAAWGPKPTARIETTTRTGWGSYAAWGPTGEAIVAHRSGTTNLVINTRTTFGTGAWTQTDIPSPTGASGMLWPRIVSTGANHDVIHIIALTAPTGNGGTVYQGQDGALLYNRTTDGGASWAGWTLVTGIGASDYVGIGGDSYCWAEPQGNNLAFFIGDSWNDWAFWKSTDGGLTWTKTVIWPCPYNLYAGTDSVEMFWCPDGVTAGTFDNAGKIHATVGLQRGSADQTGAKFWYPFTDGLLYWNEDMPQLPAVLDPDTLYEHGNYVGWCPDTMVFYAQTTELGYYYCSMSSFPQIIADENNDVFIIWSSVTNYRDPSNFMLRHIFGRMAYDNGATWNENFYDITSDFVYNFEECVYPSMANTVPGQDKLHILFMGDTEAGVYLKGSSGAQGQTAITDNEMIIISPMKDMFGVGVDNKKKSDGAVSQNYPNPFRGTTTINVNLQNPASLSLEVYNIMGQKVTRIDKGYVANGAYQFVVDGSQLTSGVYFYTVRINNESYSNKMIVK